MMKILFFLSLFLIIYTYIIYPVFLFLFASLVQLKRDMEYLWSRKDRRKKHPLYDLPEVSIIIAAYNEEKVIDEKIQNSLALNYPKDKIEIIIASDGSTDRTNSIVEGYINQGVKLLSFSERKGKSSLLSRVIPKAEGSIIALSDANTMYEHDAVINLVRHFSDPKVGGVCGELRLKPFENRANEESRYWWLENMIKFMENRIGATLGANGGIYAIRKEAFQPIPPDTVVDDFVIFLKVREKGFKTVFDPEAVAYEETAPDLKGEYKRRIRIGAGNFQSISIARKLLNPLRGTVAFSFWSHKVLRWCVPFFLVIFLFSNLFLVKNGWGYFIFFALQIIGYSLAVIGCFNRKIAFFKIPYYFASMNVAMLHGFLRFLKRNQKAAWERTER